MKNKKLTYILIPIVFIVWGLIVYRLFFEGKVTPENIMQTVKPVKNKIEISEKDTYKLIANYPDPFLSLKGIKSTEGSVKNENAKDKSNTKSNLRRRRTSISRIRWPQVKYSGFIEGNKAKHTILLEVKSKNYLAYVGDTIDQIFIKEFYGDSLLVVYKNEEKSLKK